MLIHGRITSVEAIDMKDGGRIHAVRFTDASKPMELRARGEFVCFVGDEARKALPSGDDLDNFAITIAARSFKPSDQGISIKGQLVPGHVPAENLLKGADSPLPTRSTKPGSESGK